MRPLPLSLLAASLAFATAAAPVALNVLTADNFEQTIAKGVWFIEHFSPYCRHCRDFAPTWSRLVEDATNAEDPGISLAQVNCVVDGDLCRTNGVTGYPQMNLYRNGEFVEMYKDSRSYELLTRFLSKHAELTTSPSVIKDGTTIPPDSTPTPLHVQTRTDVNPDGEVFVLNKSIFQKTIDKGPTFVKFYAPWCGHCKKLAPHWTNLAAHMQNKLTVAEVNCEEHGDICSKEGISGYPMLFYYSGGAKTEYMGGRTFDLLRDFAERASAPGVQEIQATDLHRHVAENPVIYLLLHPSSNTRILNQVTQASKVLLGSPAVLTSNAEDLFKQFKIPSSSWALIVFKDFDFSTPAAIFHSSPSSIDTNSLSTWLLHNRLPTTLELNQESFQSVMNAPNNPLVVIVATSKENEGVVKEKLVAIGSRWRVEGTGQRQEERRAVVFTWMDRERWGSWLKGMYGIKDGMNGVVTVVSDHGRLIYWDSDQEGRKIQVSTTSIFSAIKAAEQGLIKPKHSENLFERMVRNLNDKLTFLETLIILHPWRVGFFVVLGLIVLYMILKRLIADDVSDSISHLKKSERLD